MDIYDLILSQGVLGALKYADKIEKTNTKLASKIDNAVIKLYNNTRLAQVPSTYNRNQNLSLPNNTTPAQSATNQVGNSSAPGVSAAGLGLEAANDTTINLARIQAFRRAMALRYNNQINLFMSLLKQGNTNAAAKILNNAPNDLAALFGGNSLTIRSNFLQAAKYTLGYTPKYNEFIHFAAGEYAKDAAQLAKNQGLKGLLGKIMPNQSQTTAFLHPGLQGLSNGLPGVTQAELQGMQILDATKLMAKKDLETALHLGKLTPAEFSQFANESPNAIFSFLKRINEPTLHLDYLQNHLVNDGFKASEELLTHAPPSNVGKLEGILTKLMGTGSKFTFLGGILKLGMKVLGPLAVILDAKGFFDEYVEYGLDSKTICNLCSVILGASSLVPLLTPFAGPLWLIVSVGCFFVQHGKKKTDQVESKPKDDLSTIVDENKLTTKDQDLYNKLMKENEGNTDQFNLVMEQALDNGQFQNPDLVRKTLEK